jgi:hypothetical protein
MNSFVLPAATLWQRELVRFWRQKSRVLGVVASPLVFWLVIGYGSNDLARFYSGSLVLTVMFSAIFSISIIAGSPRRLSAFDAGLARAAYQHGARQDSRVGHTRLDPGYDLPRIRAARRRADPNARHPSGSRRHLLSKLRADRSRLRDRVADGIHRRLPRHHEPPPAADVDGFRFAVSHGDGPRRNPRDHVDQPPDVFHRAGQPHPASAQRRAGRPKS